MSPSRLRDHYPQLEKIASAAPQTPTYFRSRPHSNFRSAFHTVQRNVHILRRAILEEFFKCPATRRGRMDYFLKRSSKALRASFGRPGLTGADWVLAAA